MNVFQKVLILVVILFFQISFCAPLKIVIFLKRPLGINQQYLINQIDGLMKNNFSVWLVVLEKKDIYSDSDFHYKYDQEIQSKFVCNEYIAQDFKNPDLILCEYGSLALEVVSLKLQGGISGKLIVFYRGGDVTELKKYSEEIKQTLFHEIDCFAPVCEAFKNELIASGCPKNKIKIIPSAIDTEFFFRKSQPSNETITILSVGRLVEKKGFEYAIKALIPHFKRLKHLKYIIVGDGPAKNSLENLIKKYHLQDRVILLGWQNQNEVKKLLEKSHIFLSPSIESTFGTKEGIPNSIKEAMLMELPVIGTFHSGIPEIIIHKKNGLLVKEKNIYGLSQAIEYLIENPLIRQKFGILGKELILKYYNTKIESEKFALFLIELCSKNIQDDSTF